MTTLNFTDLPETHQVVVERVCASQHMQPEALTFQHVLNDEYNVLENGKPTTYMLFFNTTEMD